MSCLSWKYGWVFLCAGLLGGLPANANLPILRILNWSEYIDMDAELDPGLPIAQQSPTLRSFAKKYGCEVEYSEFETSEEAMRLLGQTPGHYDVVIIDGANAEQLLRAGIAMRPDVSKIPNFKHIDPALLEAFGGDDLAGVPYLYGSTGILYRKDFYPEGMASWHSFFDPKNPHPVTVLAEARSMFAQALVAHGLDPVNPTEHDIRTVAKYLRNSTEAGRIQLRTSDIDLIQRSVINGDIGAAVIYSGDALSVCEENSNIGFALPEEGFEIYMDCFMFVEGSSKKDLAHAFINYILEPGVHARLSQELLYASPNLSSLEILKSEAPELLSNAAVYPPTVQLSKGYPLKLDDPLIDRFAKILFKR